MNDGRAQRIEHEIIKPDDALAFFGKCRANIIASADREQAWLDCATMVGRKVRAKEIGRAYAADELDRIIREQSLFPDDDDDGIQAKIAAAFQGKALQREPSKPTGSAPADHEADETVARWERTHPHRSKAASVGLPLTFLDPTAWEGQAIPPRRWLVPQRIPLANVTMLNGDGSAGKTTITLQLAVAALRGTDWLGSVIDAPGPAIFLTAEEDEDEIQRRLAAILEQQNIGFRDLVGLHPLCMPGADVVLGAPDRSGVIQPTPLLDRLSVSASAIRPSLIAIEAAADVYAGNENDRAQVRQFIALLRRLALDSGAAVLLIAHPSLTGLASGTGTSGSTAWNNSVRSRLYFTGAKRTDDDDESDIRELKVMKSNYGPAGEVVRLRWQRGVFLLEGGPGMLERVAAEAAVDQAYLDCLDATLGSGRQVGPYPSSVYAPTIFEKMPQANGYRAKALAAAQERLFGAGRIQVVKIGPKSKERERIARKAAP